MIEVVRTNDLLAIQALLKESKDCLNARDNFSNTPLYYSCRSGYPSEIIKLLLTKGANTEL